MKKRLLAVVMVIAMTVSLAIGCGSGGGSDSGGSTGGDSSDKSPENLKIAVVVNQKFGDNGPMDDLAAGADRAAKDFGVTVKKLESESAAKFEEDVRAMSADYDLVVTTFPYMSDATVLVAGEYPDTKYAAIFQFVNVDGTSIENIWDSEFHGEQAFYINGYMAAKLSKTGKIGMVIGGEEPSPNAEGNGFMLGAKAANPDITVECVYVGSYEDPAKAKEITSAMIAKGCDFVQTDSGASNAGVVEACKDAGILCSGEITDFYDTYDGFVGIIGIGFGDTLYKAVEMLANDSWEGGEHGIRDLANGGYFMDWESYERFADNNAEYGEEFKTVIEEAKQIEQQIIDGSVEVPFDTEVADWSKFAE